MLGIAELRDLLLKAVTEAMSGTEPNNPIYRVALSLVMRDAMGPLETGGIHVNNRIFVPARSLLDWQSLLRDPVKQWKDCYSAKELAECWFSADGFPPSVQASLDAAFGEHVEMLLGIPEYKVGLPGGRAASQTDLMVLARTRAELVVIAVEGKVDESFGDLVKDWLNDPKAGPGRAPRLDYIRSVLDLKQVTLDCIRYQLLHRTASALIVAKEFHAKKVVMLVHSFSDKDSSFADFSKFCGLWQVTPQIGTVKSAAHFGGIELYLGWVRR